ncbi:hypothetical protein HETIRDRAFT_315978 [Heterobasidion irregulare TC 32-1]|uniref:Isochorismatase-like domain-containing protein n=1 Tax=Heterobasidion irregulare (strain TC 32-1) TaxID=747525 RepID=W4KCN2_HETIT|nr:uncharacterized protein HETIRDRAFT_315978 [Heterobasidion irregulare TC 32-1]ETW83100.1 hypothetical protein HETIRDRAFT_315978 [Heterobasidion irregulare TC 32-1]
MINRPPVESPTSYGNATSFWVEYPSGLVDLTRSSPLVSQASASVVQPPLTDAHLEVPVDGGRIVRVDKTKAAFVIIDMQNYFLHPDMRDHPTGLACVEPLLKAVPALRSQGVKTLWVNWGLTEHELSTIPPSLVRSFMKNGRGGFGSDIPGNWGRLLMRGERNADLYGPLQDEYLKGKDLGSDMWIHKNRMSGIWGYQTSLDLYLEQAGITTLFFAGVNADQCVLGTIVDAYYRGYDVILVEDAVATTSPAGGLENVVHNIGNVGRCIYVTSLL